MTQSWKTPTTAQPSNEKLFNIARDLFGMRHLNKLDSFIREAADPRISRWIKTTDAILFITLVKKPLNTEIDSRGSVIETQLVAVYWSHAKVGADAIETPINECLIFYLLNRRGPALLQSMSIALRQKKILLSRPHFATAPASFGRVTQLGKSLLCAKHWLLFCPAHSQPLTHYVCGKEHAGFRSHRRHQTLLV